MIFYTCTRTLTADNYKDIERFKANSIIGRTLSEIKYVWKYTVGDVLIRHKIETGSAEIDLISDACPVPKKFLIMHIDDLGIPWVKRLSVRGGLGTALANLTEIWGDGKYRFSVDPEQIDSILLGYAYDPLIEYRRFKNENPSYGKSKTE